MERRQRASWIVSRGECLWVELEVEVEVERLHISLSSFLQYFFFIEFFCNSVPFASSLFPFSLPLPFSSPLLSPSLPPSLSLSLSLFHFRVAYTTTQTPQERASVIDRILPTAFMAASGVPKDYQVQYTETMVEWNVSNGRLMMDGVDLDEVMSYHLSSLILSAFVAFT